MTLRNKLGKTIAAGLLSLVAACGGKGLDSSADFLLPITQEHMNYAKENYRGFGSLTPKNNVVGFDNVFQTEDGHYIARIAASSFLLDNHGKLLTQGGHFIEKRPDGKIFTGYGAECVEAHVDLSLFDGIAAEHGDLLQQMVFPEMPLGKHGLPLHRVTLSDEEFYRRRTANDAWRMIKINDSKQDELAGRVYEKHMNLVEDTFAGHLFERREDGLYAKLK